MLTLNLTLDNKQITVRTDGQESHSFSLLDLGQTDKEWKGFFKGPRPYGEKLFQALFKGDSQARKAFDELSKQAERTIVLVLESSKLDGIAWEYAYHDNAYIVEDFAFIRALPEKERPHANGRLSKSVERVPLLFIPANPLVDLSGEPMRELDIESEWHEMTQHIVKSNAPFDLIELRPATPAALQSIMARFQNGMIAHFSGHGAATKDGAFLLFENENGSSNPLEAREFVREVKDQAWISFLSACQSAVAERTEYSNLARELVKAGVPFALGMQFNLPDPFAPVISGQFYNWLAQGHAIPEATMQARRAVKRENEFFVGMIALYAAHPDEAGKMNWSGSGARALSTFTAAGVSDLPTPSGFIGRQRELMNIGTRLLEKKKPNTVTLHGAGGIGKTALMRQALLRFAPSFEAALAIALDPLPSLENVLGRLERFLILSSPCANDTREREKIVRERLTNKRTLLGLDNFETLIHARDNGSDEEKKTAKSLYAFFKSLAAEGVTLCVTSREKTSLPGETIQEIHGLEDEVGGRLFQNTVSTRRDALNEEGLEKISAAVGGHPLALRLLAPIFEEQAGLTLDDFLQRLETFLPKAHDEWTEQERHESLGMCFAFSVDNLPRTEDGKKLQIAISRLSMFTAFFISATAAPVLENHFPESTDEFQQMLPNANNILHALWERCLLERVAFAFEDENYYAYRLNPALRFFARERLIDVETVKENYWKSLGNFSGIAKEQASKSPLIAQFTLLSMPDLLAIASSRNDIDAASMQFNLSIVLDQFGSYKEAIRLLEKSCEICELHGQEREMGVRLGALANIYIGTGYFEKGISLLKDELAIAIKFGNKHEESFALSQMADVFVSHGNVDEARNLYLQAFQISEDLGDLKGKSTLLHEIANTYALCDDLDTAMELYQQALKLKESFNDLQGKSATLRQMAHIYAKRNDLKSATICCQEALNIQEKLGDIKGKSVTLHIMADIYAKQGNFDGSAQLYLQTLNIQEELGDIHGQAITFAALGQLLVIEKKYSLAITLLVKSLKNSSFIGLDYGIQTVVKILEDIRDEIGTEMFRTLWEQIAGEPLPDWLFRSDEQEDSVTIE